MRVFFTCFSKTFDRVHFGWIWDIYIILGSVTWWFYCFFGFFICTTIIRGRKLQFFWRIYGRETNQVALSEFALDLENAVTSETLMIPIEIGIHSELHFFYLKFFEISLLLFLYKTCLQSTIYFLKLFWKISFSLRSGWWFFPNHCSSVSVRFSIALFNTAELKLIFY